MCVCFGTLKCYVGCMGPVWVPIQPVIVDVLFLRDSKAYMLVIVDMQIVFFCGSSILFFACVDFVDYIAVVHQFVVPIIYLSLCPALCMPCIVNRNF